MEFSHDGPDPVPFCPACTSSKTIRVEANDWKRPMLFCGTCGHMWAADARVPLRKPLSIFTDPDFES